MANDTLLLKAAKALKLDEDIAALEALRTAADKSAELVEQLKGKDGVAAIEDVVAAIKSPEVKAAFEALGIDKAYADLVAWIDRIGGAVPKPLLALLRPLSAFKTGSEEAQISWALSTGPLAPVKTDAYALNLEADAKLAFDAAAAWPDETPPPRLLKVDANGKVEVGANATAPYSYGKGEFGAGASANTDLAYYFAAQPTEIYAAALASRVGSLPNPYDLSAVWKALDSTDLEGIVFRYGGGAHANLKIDFADALALGAGVTSEVSFEVAVSASVDSKYLLTLRRSRTDAGGLAMTAQLTRTRKDEKTFNDALKIGVDLSSLTKPVVAALKRAVDSWNAALEEVKPYLSPGTLLRSKAADWLEAELGVVVSDETLRAALLDDLKGALGLQDSDDSNLIDWLKDKITGAIDAGRTLADGEQDKAVKRVMDLLTDAAPMLIQADTQKKLETAIAAQIDKLETGLKKAVDDVFAKPAADVKAAITKAGGAVTGAVNSADDLLKPVRDLLKVYDDGVQAVLKKAQEAGIERATARLYREETRTDGEKVEFAGVFTGAGPAAAKVFAAITQGALQPLVRVIDGEDASPEFKLTEDKSSLTTYSRFKSTEGLEVVFLNFKGNLTLVAEGGATVVLNGFGNLQVDDDATVKKTLELFWNTRTVSFADTHSLVLARAASQSGAPLPTFELGVAGTYSDEKMDAGDITNFIRNLTKAKLCRDEVLVLADAAFKRWSPGGGKIPGDIGAAVRIDGSAAKALMRIGARGDDGLAPADKIEIIRIGIQALQSTQTINALDFADGAVGAQRMWRNSQFPMRASELVYGLVEGVKPLYPIPKNPLLPTTPAPSDLATEAARADYQIFVKEAYRLNGLVDLIDAMGAVYEAKPALIKTDGGSFEVAGAWVLKDYRKAQEAMADASKRWLTALDNLSAIDKAAISRRTTALMRALVDLSGRPASNPGGVVVNLTYRPKGGKPETVSFS